MHAVRQALLFVALLCAACSTAPDRASVEASVQQVAERFIRGLETFDAEAIAAEFDADATLFMPYGGPRLNGVGEIRAAFHADFDELHAAGETQVITPRRPNVQVLGDTAILTFELGGVQPGSPGATGYLGRRTAVLHRFADGWRIVHLHASSFEVEAEPQ